MPYIPDGTLLLFVVTELLFWLSIALIVVGIFTQERGHWWLVLVSVVTTSIASATYGYTTRCVEYYSIGMVGLVVAGVLGSAFWLSDDKNVPPPSLRYYRRR